MRSENTMHVFIFFCEYAKLLNIITESWGFLRDSILISPKALARFLNRYTVHGIPGGGSVCPLLPFYLFLLNRV